MRENQSVSPRQRKAYVTALLVAAAYFLLGRLALVMAIPPGVATPVWPASGIALAALLRYGNAAWPGVFLGSFLVNFPTLLALPEASPWGRPLAVAVAIALGSTAQALFGARLVGIGARWTMSHFSSGGKPAQALFESARGIFALGGAVLAGCLVASSSGTLALVAAGYLARGGALQTWLTWWVGDVVGIFVVTPIPLLARAGLLAFPDKPWRIVEGLALVTLFLVLGLVVFGGHAESWQGSFPYPYLLMPLLVWASFRFGFSGAVFTSLFTAGIAVWSASKGFGPFEGRSANVALILSQSVVGIFTCTALAIAAEVASRRKREAELREKTRTLELEQKWLEELLDRLPVPLILVEPGTADVTFSNAAADALAGGKYPRDRRTLEEIEGFFGTSPDGARLRFAELPRSKIARGERIPGLRMTWHTPTGEHPLLVHAETLPASHGRPAIGVVTFQDIRELDATERELKRSNAELARFAYVASHDLKEPLRMIISYVQLLRRRYREKLDGTAEEYMTHVVAGATRMWRLIEDLLAFSRVGAEGAADEPVDTRDAVREALANLEAAVTESGAVFRVGDLPVVRGNRAQLVQLFQNLVGNALKYRGDATPRIEITAARSDDAYRFCVRDNGIGIEPQYFERIFVVFQRLHGREAFAGTGIGLALCKKIVEQHGGKIGVDSTPGKGSTFWFTLPHVRADRPERPASRLPATA